jgi:poly-gamma-glutamate synthesis protein (capsule biosynthesis protein)
MITVCAVGDIMFGEQPVCNGFGVKSLIKKNGTDYLLKNVENLLNGDIVYGNLEAPVTNRLVGLNKDYFKVNINILPFLRRYNFNILNIANNHIMEHGEDVFNDTIRHMVDNDIKPVGLLNSPQIINLKNKKIAFLSYSTINDYKNNVLYNYLNDYNSLKKQISELRNLIDIIILALHWGDEHVLIPSSQQIRLGHDLVKAGVDIILGGHPHVLQGFEKYREKLIIYSLGNFIFDQSFLPNTLNSIIFKIDIEDDIITPSFHPIVINPYDYKIMIPDEDKKNMIITELEKTNKLIAKYSINENKYEKNYNKLLRRAKIDYRCRLYLHVVLRSIRSPLNYAPNLIQYYLSHS